MQMSLVHLPTDAALETDLWSLINEMDVHMPSAALQPHAQYSYAMQYAPAAGSMQHMDRHDGNMSDMDMTSAMGCLPSAAQRCLAGLHSHSNHDSSGNNGLGQGALVGSAGCKAGLTHGQDAGALVHCRHHVHSNQLPQQLSWEAGSPGGVGGGSGGIVCGGVCGSAWLQAGASGSCTTSVSNSPSPPRAQAGDAARQHAAVATATAAVALAVAAGGGEAAVWHGQQMPMPMPNLTPGQDAQTAQPLLVQAPGEPLQRSDSAVTPSINSCKEACQAQVPVLDLTHRSHHADQATLGPDTLGQTISHLMAVPDSILIGMQFLDLPPRGPGQVSTAQGISTRRCHSLLLYLHYVLGTEVCQFLGSDTTIASS